MKKYSILTFFLFSLLISSSAFACGWVTKVTYYTPWSKLALVGFSTLPFTALLYSVLNSKKLAKPVTLIATFFGILLLWNMVAIEPRFAIWDDPFNSLFVTCGLSLILVLAISILHNPKNAKLTIGVVVVSISLGLFASIQGRKIQTSGFKQDSDLPSQVVF